MKIDKKLNLVCTVSRDDGSLVYVHTSPFPYEVVEEHCLMLGSLFTSFIAQVGGLGAARVAAMMLRKKIKQEQAVTGQTGPNIVDEIQRQTTVIFNENGQWKPSPLETAMKLGIITADEFREVEGEIVFFMVSSAIQKPELIKPTVGSVIDMFGGQLTLSTATEWRDSLLTSKTDTATQPQNAPQVTSFIPS
ncbi:MULTISPECIES: hypothetical protein [Citrobacter freundii complex]|uniref:hypothetical protein n=1 Tax=Citrobacter freundii complex TaxID=1344959 RepID=UPI0017801DEF|nr:hypothetical protein [Citrobacter portucalensis]MBD9984599.1 hypothetical protein [Citrobacter portucalensis]MBE0031823.1 hypothetical protein [Citrobacter portucalensis]MBE0039844.1 hypothetical protein [Citrobacter portucalensis]MBE0046798.1 hypothetical protein [Citrobacter portucalensis]MBE0076419.1 hypothetical protein [Citrobacter portucalensis]